MAADKLSHLGLGSEVRELKIGSSFTRNSSNAFHTIRYDFKPASVDPNKMGILQVGDSNSVTVTVPHMNGTGVTNFNGHAKEGNKKECVLIIDPETGEITLEKLSSQMLVKKTRPERPEKGNGSIGSNALNGSNGSGHHSTFNQKKISKASPASTVSPIRNNSPKPQTLHHNNHHHHHRSSGAYSMPSMVSSETLEDMDDNSMPSSLFDIGDFGNSDPPPTSKPSPRLAQPFKSMTKPPQSAKPVSQPTRQPIKKAAGDLSESSSSDSSSSDSDSDEFEEVRSNVPDKSGGSSDNVLMSMPSFSTSPPTQHPPPRQNVKASMPTLSLSDDLQLSESDDSDD